jgi:hypothetical protein
MLALFPNQMLRYALQTQSDDAQLQSLVTIGMLYHVVMLRYRATQMLEDQVL